MITPPTLAQVLATMAELGHVVFSSGPWDLNLIGLRAIPPTVDVFDDLFVVPHLDAAGTWQMPAWPCTLDPGKPSLLAPRRRDGTAIIRTGQQRGAFKIGEHHAGTPRAYPALVPARPILVWRDANRDDVLDYRNGTASTSWGTNIHRAQATGRTLRVGPWSEGCAVFQEKPDHDALMVLCRRQVQAGRGDTFTLTIVEWPSVG